MKYFACNTKLLNVWKDFHVKIVEKFCYTEAIFYDRCLESGIISAIGNSMRYVIDSYAIYSKQTENVM